MARSALPRLSLQQPLASIQAVTHDAGRLAQRRCRCPCVAPGIRLSPSDPRLFMWLPTLAGAHYQLRQYGEAVEFGRRSWSLNRNWPHGLRYVVAGLAQLGKIEEAQAALTELK